MRNVLYILAVVFLLFSPTAGHAADASSIDELDDQIQRQLMCLCGCNSTLKSCPHVNCDFAIPRRREIRQMLEQGKSRGEIISFMTDKYGEKILAAPKKEGFNLLGYVMPFVALVVVGSIVAVTVKKWASRGEPGGAPGAGGSPKAAREESTGGLKELMEEELRDFD